MNNLLDNYNKVDCNYDVYIEEHPYKPFYEYMTFYDRYIRGIDKLSDIDIHIEKWHNSTGDCAELHKYLGLTLDEYSHWVKSPKSLLSILQVKYYKDMNELLS